MHSPDTSLSSSLFMLSLADPSKYWQLILAQGVGMGVGQGLLLVPAYAIQAHHWKKRRSLAMGIVSTGTFTISLLLCTNSCAFDSGTSIGGIVYPIMLNQLFKSSAGFAWGVRASAFLTMALLFISNCVMTTRPPKSSSSTKPSGSELKMHAMNVLKDFPFMIAVYG